MVLIMARERMITRNITEVEVRVMAVDLTTNELIESVLIGNPMFVNDELKQLNYLKTHYNTPTYIVVKINEQKENERLLGMYEKDFISQAFELDPLTRKPLN